jgi:hypothetical protein
MGDAPANISAEAQEWEGTWMGPDGAVTAHVVDAPRGLLTVAWHEKNMAGDGLESKTADLQMRRLCSSLYISTPATEKNFSGLFVWARIRVHDRVAIVWPPDVEAFKTMVENGTLSGTNEGENVILDELTAEQIARLCEQESQFLRWDDPVVFWKVAD